jgi:FKBP-type peptidyl-prolyl cis-trans isomerase SlyD
MKWEILMQIKTNAVVSIHYTLTNKTGEVLDTSDGSEPLAYLHGRGNLIPGLEKELEGKEKGNRISVTVPPEEAYGIHDESLIREVAREAFKDIQDLQPGMQFQSQNEKGVDVFTITKIEGDKITIDGNHSLAGETLSFKVEITDVREATEEEVTHGHVHGPEGHHH